MTAASKPCGCEFENVGEHDLLANIEHAPFAEVANLIVRVLCMAADHNVPYLGNMDFDTLTPFLRAHNYENRQAVTDLFEILEYACWRAHDMAEIRHCLDSLGYGTQFPKKRPRSAKMVEDIRLGALMAAKSATGKVSA